MIFIFPVVAFCASLIVLAAALILLTIGIRCQERAGSLACEPAGWCGCMARSLLGLHVRSLDAAHTSGSGHAGN